MCYTLSECTCGVKDYDECENCRECRYHECECTKTDFQIGDLREELEALTERVFKLESDLALRVTVLEDTLTRLEGL